jgi:hypothetical protein
VNSGTIADKAQYSKTPRTRNWNPRVSERSKEFELENVQFVDAAILSAYIGRLSNHRTHVDSVFF